MQHRASYISSGLVIICVANCLAGPASGDELPEARNNLLASPSFEEPAGDSGLPPGWFGLYSMPAEAYRREIADTGRTGKRSLLIEGKGQFGVAWGEKLPIDRAQRYRARGYVRIEGDEQAAADVKLHYYGAGQEYLGQSRVGFVNPRTPGWQLITVTDQIERFPQARFISIAVAIAGNGKAWFDDIELWAAPEKRGGLNYVANGGMEDVAADRPAGYFVVAAPGGKVECRSHDDRPFAGKRCLRLVSRADWAAAGAVQVETKAAKSFAFNGRVRVAEGKARIGIGYFDANGKFLGGSNSETIGPGDWRALKATSELDRFPEAAKLNAVCFIEGEGTADFDELEMTATEK